MTTGRMGGSACPYLGRLFPRSFAIHVLNLCRLQRKAISKRSSLQRVEALKSQRLVLFLFEAVENQ